jgi:hypothetical protein
MPSGFVILYIVTYGIILAVGRCSSENVDPLYSTRFLVSAISHAISTLIAIFIIVGGFRVSHLERYSAKAILISIIPVIAIFVASMLAVRAHPTSALFIMLNGLCLIMFAFLAGELLSREILNPGHLIPVAAVLTLVDFWSVGHGPSSKIARQVTEFAQSGGFTGEVVPDFTSFLLLRFPQFITTEIISFLGVSDILILAFLVGCIHKFNLPQIQSYAALIAGPVIAVLIANIIGKGIPALPVIALIFLFTNIKHLKMQKNDIAISILVIVVIIILIIIFRLFFS